MKILHPPLLLVIGFIIVGSNLNAQIDNHPWCPTGATWLYQKIGFFSQQYLKLTYTNDTIINNINTKILSISEIEIVGPGPFPNYSRTEQHIGYEYYANINDTIYWWHNGQFHFLYDFSSNSTINAQWIINQNTDYPCPGATLPTTDTFEIDSFTTNSYSNVIFACINGTDNGNWTLGEKIIKNIGSTRTPYPIPINNDCYGTGGATHLPLKLNCYYDNLRGRIIFETPLIGDCDYVTTPIKKIKKNTSAAIDVFPIPTSDEIFIQSNSLVLETYEIYTINGQLLEQNSIASSSISLRNYPTGVYFLILKPVNSPPHAFKIIKI
jgi:hypothetical protein